MTATIAQMGPKSKDKDTEGSKEMLESVFSNKIPVGKKWLVRVELTTLLSAMGAIARKEK